MKGTTPGLKPFQIFPQFKSKTFNKVDPTANVYETVLSVVGSGALYMLRGMTDDAATVIMRIFQITIDGATAKAISSNTEAGNDWWMMVDLGVQTFTMSKTPQKLFYLPFRTSLLIEMKTTVALVAGKKISAVVDYGEV